VLGVGFCVLLSVGAHAQSASSASDDTPVHGQGLSLRKANPWSHWAGRIGAVVDRPLTSLPDDFRLAPPADAGLSLRSMHILSDYYLDGGLRATAGVLRGEIGASNWAAGDNGSGFGLSVQRMAGVGLLPYRLNGAWNDPTIQTIPYLGAGYSHQLRIHGVPSAWRLNADLGLASYGTSSVNHVSQVLQGDAHLDDLVRELRLRPIVKVSVGYSF
jgi:hypothetical protein